MVCFIILHYLILNETVVCVERLRALKGNKKIIIVDNCSPNGSGKQLEERFYGDDIIDVILNEENVGFARGNNIGCEFAKKKYDPDFYIVMNNDVEIVQDMFITQVSEIWEREHFDVLSPDIYSTTGKVHQSPKSLKRMTLERAKVMQCQYEKKLRSKVLVPFRCYVKQIKLLKILYNRRKSSTTGIDYSRVYYDVPLHGACFIFSKNFIQARATAFFPGTFFYFESEILDYECQKYGYKTMYDPSIQVLHHQNVSTNTAYKNALKKVRFMNEQNYRSITAFLETYSGDKVDEK